MPKIAEAECATCHHILPKTEMREVRVSRVIGGSFSSSSSSRTGYRHSSGFNSRGQWRNGNSNSSGRGTTTRGTTRTRVEYMWVCNGCKAPRSDGWLSSLLLKLAVAGAILYFGAVYLTGRGSKSSADTETATITSTPKQSTEERSTQIEDQSSPTEQIEEKPSVLFAPPREVVQPAPPPPKEYPPCSDTVQDQCVSN